MSNNCKIDDVFKVDIVDFEKQHGSCISTFSEHNRLIATNTVLIANKYGEENLSYIGIDQEGIIKLGTGTGDSKGESQNGAPGLQPFVRGDDLESILIELIDILSSTFNTIGTAMQASTIASIPIISLLTNAPIVTTNAGSISSIKGKLKNFKSQ